MIYGVSIHEKPLSKERPRFAKNGHVYTPKKTRVYEEIVAWSWRSKYKDMKLDGPLVMKVTSYFQRPKGADDYMTRRPDVDNLAKAIMDGLNGVAYDDDAQIWELITIKRWTDEDPRTEVQIDDGT